MSRKSLSLIGLLAVLVIGAGLGLTGWWRQRDARRFSQVYNVRTYGSTNYAVQLLEVAIGKSETGCVLIVSARLQNPNPHPVTLKREWFVLVDHEKNYYAADTTGPHAGTINLPAHGAAEKEAFSFVLPEKALEGVLALAVGHQYFVLVKSARPFSRQLGPGEFVQFRQLTW